MEFESDAIHLENNKAAVIITKWLNVGQGHSSADKKWRRHVDASCRGEPIATKEDSSVLRRAFESHAEKSREMAIRENVALLSGGLYRKKLRRVDRGIPFWRNQVR